MIFLPPRHSILGTGRYAPKEVITNSHFEGRDLYNYDSKGNRVGDAIRLTDDKIVKQTGMRERRRSAPDEWPSDMAYHAAIQALEMAGIEAKDLVGIVMASVTERENFASGAQKTQLKLGAINVRVTYDMQNACAGYPEAIMEAEARSLRLPGYWLILGAETLTKIVEDDDVNSDLFSDMAGAAVIGPERPGSGVIVAGYSDSNPFNGKIGYINKDPRGFLRMSMGPYVRRFASREMPSVSKALNTEARWERPDLIIPHQANAVIVEEVAQKSGAKIIRNAAEIGDFVGPLVYMNLENYGNPSAASCAFALDECVRDGIIKPGSKVQLIAVGASMSTSAVALEF